ncbi:hypothetical protein [Micromonospora sp. NPDC023888]|uniref:hypothetical protein n=1 Tax=Micromonospora sp. NPDC023888 TaxID=3155607 RepID=UPI0033D1A10E
MILLMAFSIIFWLLGNTTMAVVAGMGACTLAADEIRPATSALPLTRNSVRTSSRRPTIPGGMTNERGDRPAREAA